MPGTAIAVLAEPSLSLQVWGPVLSIELGVPLPSLVSQGPAPAVGWAGLNSASQSSQVHTSQLGRLSDLEVCLGKAPPARFPNFLDSTSSPQPGKQALPWDPKAS